MRAHRTRLLLLVVAAVVVAAAEAVLRCRCRCRSCCCHRSLNIFEVLAQICMFPFRRTATVNCEIEQKSIAEINQATGHLHEIETCAIYGA